MYYLASIQQELVWRRGLRIEALEYPLPLQRISDVVTTVDSFGSTREDSSKCHLFLVICREYISQGLEHSLPKSLMVSVIVLSGIKEDLSYLEIFHVHLSFLETIFICKFLGTVHMDDPWDDA